LVFPAEDLVSWKDVTPKMGLAWDVTGNGKTAVRVNLGKYLDPARAGGTYSGPNPVSRISTSITRTWTDADRDYVPDCDLLNLAAQDLRASGGDFCAGASNVNFGKKVFSNTYDPDLLTGWGKRPSDWSFGASVQREVLPRVSLEVGYFRRWWGNFVVTDNQAVAASDYTAFSVVAPSDARLPGGGGNTISGLYDVDPAKFGQTNNFITLSKNFGNQYENFNAVDVTVNARMKNGLTFSGGTSTGQGVTDNCEIKAKLPEIGPTNPYCHTATGWLTQFRGLGSYTIPKADVLLSATFQSVQGPNLAANYALPAAVTTAALGRPAAGSSILTVNLVSPGSLYGDRTNQLDFRAGKIFKFGRTKAQVSVDVYNVLNSAAVLGYNQTFIPSGAWLTPNSVITARFVRISGQFDF
jgi:hypothetical protein